MYKSNISLVLLSSCRTVCFYKTAFIKAFVIYVNLVQNKLGITFLMSILLNVMDQK